MGLIEIEYGALASSTTMNTNFSYLDNRINASNESIVSIQNSLSSMNTTLSQSIENSKLFTSTAILYSRNVLMSSKFTEFYNFFQRKA